MENYKKHILEEPVASTVISHRFSHAVWGAVFAGAFVVTVTEMTLALLGSSIGLSTLNITEGNNLKALGIGAVIWWIVTGCISFYVGGLVSGRMSGIPRRQDGMLHGILSFCLTTVFVSLFLTTSLGAIVGGSLGLLNSSAKAVTAMAPQIAQGVGAIVPQDQMNSNINSARDQASKQDLQATAQQAGETTQKASHAAGGMAFAGFIMLILGAFFAGLGGSVGSPHWADQEIT